LIDLIIYILQQESRKISKNIVINLRKKLQTSHFDCFDSSGVNIIPVYFFIRCLLLILHFFLRIPMQRFQYILNLMCKFNV